MNSLLLFVTKLYNLLKFAFAENDILIEEHRKDKQKLAQNTENERKLASVELEDAKRRIEDLEGSCWGGRISHFPQCPRQLSLLRLPLFPQPPPPPSPSPLSSPLTSPSSSAANLSLATHSPATIPKPPGSTHPPFVIDIRFRRT